LGFEQGGPPTAFDVPPLSPRANNDQSVFQRSGNRFASGKRVKTKPAITTDRPQRRGPVRLLVIGCLFLIAAIAVGTMAGIFREHALSPDASWKTPRALADPAF
jgi:hypothetical protein